MIVEFRVNFVDTLPNSHLLKRLFGKVSPILSALPDGDKPALAAFGIDFAVRQCTELLQAGVPGLHIYTMGRGEAAVGIVERLRSEGLL